MIIQLTGLPIHTESELGFVSVVYKNQLFCINLLLNSSLLNEGHHFYLTSSDFPFPYPFTGRPPIATHGTHPNSSSPRALADGQIVLGSFAVATQCPGLTPSSLL